MKKLKIFLAIVFLGFLSTIFLPTKAFAAGAVSNIAINFTEPKLGNALSEITLDNVELTDSSSASLKNGVILFSASQTFLDETGNYVQATNYSKSGKYTITFRISLNTTLAFFEGSGTNYTGSLTVNGVAAQYAAASSSSIMFILTYDLRTEKYFDNADLYYYPTLGSQYEKSARINLGENLLSRSYLFKGVEDDLWEELTFAWPAPIYETGTKYILSFNNVTSNANIINFKNKTPTATSNVYEVTINFNNEPVTAKFDANSKSFSFSYVYGEIKSSFDITFDANGHGTAPEKVTVVPGATVSEPEDLTDDYYVFDGWYKDEECTKAYDFSKKVYKDTTLYAKWSKPGFTLTFNRNGGFGTMNDITDLTGTYVLPTNGFIAPVGKRFKGWSLTSNGPIVTALDMTEDRTVYAVWTDLFYNITFNTNGGTGISYETKAPYGIYALPENTFVAPEKMRFKGWALAKDGETIASLNVTKNTDLYAIWEEVYSYEYLSGDNQEFSKGETNGYTFRIDGDNEKFVSLKIGGIDFVRDVDYTVSKGSTIITLTEVGINKLNELASGTYAVEAKFEDGVVTGNLTINDKKADSNMGGDILSIIIICVASLVVLGGCVMLVKKIKR